MCQILCAGFCSWSGFGYLVTLPPRFKRIFDDLENPINRKTKKKKDHFEVMPACGTALGELTLASEMRARRGNYNMACSRCISIVQIIRYQETTQMLEKAISQEGCDSSLLRPWKWGEKKQSSYCIFETSTRIVNMWRCSSLNLTHMKQNVNRCNDQCQAGRLCPQAEKNFNVELLSGTIDVI